MTKPRIPPMPGDKGDPDWELCREVQDLSRLSVWEEEFVENVADQLAQGRGLTERQREVLERIQHEKG